MKNSNGEKTQNVRRKKNSKSENVTKLKLQQNLQTQIRQNTPTQIVTKLKNMNDAKN